MRAMTLAASTAALVTLTSTSYAGAGVSPFLAAVSPDTLPQAVQQLYDFRREDVVYVMSVADAEQVSWHGYVWGPHGQPLIGRVSAEIASDEVVAITETGFLTGGIVALADDDVLQDLVDAALVGPCGAEPPMTGLVQGDLVATSIAAQLPRLSAAEPAVATAAYRLDTEPVTHLSARQTGSTPVTVIEPDSMAPGGWCRANR